jgi:beta-galactosidase/beta-glucuronidase
MYFRRITLLIAVLISTQMTPALARDASRVSPAYLPIPLPTAAPVSPDRLRAANPWNLPMTGPWRFELTHGRIVAGRYEAADAAGNAVTSSSNEERNPPEHAFDGQTNTRWCADSGTFPQWLQADLGRIRHVTGVTLVWERSYERYRCRIEGGPDGKHWKTLADASAAPGIGDGPVTLKPTDVRYLRVMVTGSQGGWASLRECGIRLLEGGQEIAWRPPAPRPAPVSKHADDFALPGYDDRTWNVLAIPSNWEMAGYSLPTYNAVDKTVGLYRRWVEVPNSWTGRHIYWRFDGALDGAEIFVNGRRAGYHESGYTAFDVDLTGLVQPGRRNLFAVRVCKSTPSADCETGDFQAMGGIYRETSLIAVPATYIRDLTVRTPLSSDYRDAALAADVQVTGAPGEMIALIGTLVSADGAPTPVRLTAHGRIGADGAMRIALNAPVSSPRLWSAEKPNLYYLVLELTRGGKQVERVEQRFGFRQVEIKNNIVLWNGTPIKCTGVCRHDFWADKGFALTDAEWRKDLNLMKSANINAIRTSHYNHAARFLELCDEKGIYILDEVPFCWIGEKVKDPAFAPPLLQRTAETIGRDKNRPCVLAWSLGNENPLGHNQQLVRDLARQLDPTRPAFVSQMAPRDLKGQDFRDMHYPSPDDVDRYVAREAGTSPAVFSEHPHIFYQKETQDYDPGASDLWSETLIKTWDKLWQDPTILGSFIWEWQNQGIADKNMDKTRDYWYGPDRLRQENNKGIVDAYRNLKPEWWIVRSAYNPIAIGARTVTSVNGQCGVVIKNHYSFTDLGEFTCGWTALKDGKPLQTGAMHIACAPGQEVQAMFPAPAGMTELRLAFHKADGIDLASARLAATDAPAPAPPAGLSGGDTVATQIDGDALLLHNSLHEIGFDRNTGLIRYWRVRGKSLLTGGPVLNLGEAKAGSPENHYQASQPPVIDGARVTPETLTDGSVKVTVTGIVHAGGGAQQLGHFACIYTVRPNAEVAVAWILDWNAPETHLWEAGLKLQTPRDLTQMSWLRDAYFTDYPAGHIGEPTSTCRANTLQFRSSKRGLHWLTLTGGGVGLTLLADQMPLVGRAVAGPTGVTLYASSEVAGPVDFSGAWVKNHDIVTGKGRPLAGSFVLRAMKQ